MKYFQGVMPHDKLPKHNPPYGIYIVNTDTFIGPGKHWVCLIVGETCEYFDSLGNPPLELKQYLNNQNKFYIYSTKKIQGNSSDVCGDYCILYSYFRSRGVTMKEFIDMFINNKAYNDNLVEL